MRALVTRPYFWLRAALVCAAPFLGACELAGAVRDGLLDFVESRTADLLEAALPAPEPGGVPLE